MILNENLCTASRWTAAFLAVVVVLVFMWDVWVGNRFGKEATVSNVIHTWLRDEPLIVLIVAVLAWHFIWPLK